MTDFKRMLEGGGSEFERRLLASVRSERPTARLRHRMWTAIVLGQVGVGTTGLSAAAATLTKLGVITVLASALSGQSAPPGNPRSSAAVSAAAPVAAVEMIRTPSALSAAAPEAADAEEITPSRLEHPETAAEAPPVARRAGAATPAVALGAPDKRVNLALEIQLLDEVRSRLGARDSEGALAGLRRYEERFPQGTFRQEASVLRIETLASSGRRELASRQAKAFMAAHPKSPYVARLRRVAENP